MKLSMLVAVIILLILLIGMTCCLEHYSVSMTRRNIILTLLALLVTLSLIGFLLLAMRFV